MSYLVKWAVWIDDAESRVDAARKALAIQRDPESRATCFDVDGAIIDLYDDPEEAK